MRNEKIQTLIGKSFSARELAFLGRDSTFEQMLTEATDLDDFEEMATFGEMLLWRAEFPQDPSLRPGTS